MTEVVSEVIKFVFGFLESKARGKIAERLSDDDCLTHEECRRLITKALDDVKTKLDGLATGDLVNSLRSLQDGINALYQSILRVDPSNNTTPNTAKGKTRQAKSLARAASSRKTGPDSQINQAVALINAVKSLKIHSSEEFETTREKFRLAYEDATKAFANETLSIEERIQASQARIMVGILKNLEDPEAAVGCCRGYLEQLHDIAVIRGTFSVLVGEFECWHKEAKRLRIALSVHLMNRQLFDFTRKFTNLPLTMLDWPEIMLDNNRVHHPVVGNTRLMHKLVEFGARIMPLDPDFNFGEKIHPRCTVVNSEREIIAKSSSKVGTIKIHKSSGESRVFCKLSKDKDALEWQVIAMDIDVKDNLYLVVSSKEKSKKQWSFELFVFDKNGDKVLECLLSFLQKRSTPHLSFAINTDGKIAIFDGQNKIYIGNLCSKFNVERNFQMNELLNAFVRILYLDTKIIAADGIENAVCIYTEDGQFERKFKIPGGCLFRYSLAINYVTKRILLELDGNELIRFSETGDLTGVLCLGPGDWVNNANLVSHPNGTVALIWETAAAFLQL